MKPEQASDGAKPQRQVRTRVPVEITEAVDGSAAAPKRYVDDANAANLATAASAFAAWSRSQIEALQQPGGSKVMGVTIILLVICVGWQAASIRELRQTIDAHVRSLEITHSRIDEHRDKIREIDAAQIADTPAKAKTWINVVSASVSNTDEYLAADFRAGEVLDKERGHHWVKLSAIERLLVADESRRRMRANIDEQFSVQELMDETDRLLFAKPGAFDFKDAAMRDVLAASAALLVAKRGPEGDGINATPAAQGKLKAEAVLENGRTEDYAKLSALQRLLVADEYASANPTPKGGTYSPILLVMNADWELPFRRPQDTVRGLMDVAAQTIEDRQRTKSR